MPLDIFKYCKTCFLTRGYSGDISAIRTLICTILKSLDSWGREL